MVFSLATYNVWFGSDGRGQPYCTERMKGVVECLVQVNNDCSSFPVIACGFQEVIPELTATLQPLLKEAGYILLQQPGNHYGCAIAVLEKEAVLIEDGWRYYTESEQKRGFLYARIQLSSSSKSSSTNRQEILFTTTHLESPTDREGVTNAQARARQIVELEAFCNEQMNHRHSSNNLQMAVIAGDLNWDETVRDIPLIPNALKTPQLWTDVWLEVDSTNTPGNNNNKEGGYSFDCRNNPFLDGERQSRLDRILVRYGTSQSPGKGTCFRPKRAMLIGTNALRPECTIAKEVWVPNSDGFSTPTKTVRQVPIVPSDHYGVAALFEATSSSSTNNNDEVNHRPGKTKKEEEEQLGTGPASKRTKT